MDKNEIYQAITADAGRGELAFPTSARLAMQVRRTLDDPNCHIDMAARLIQAEPLLSARVVAVANSVVYNRTGREINDVRTSVALLGFNTTRSMAMALVARQLAGEATVPAQQALTNQLWEHTAHVASLAHVIARHVTRVDPEAALFAGIVHEVGGFYMLSRAKDFPDLLDGDFSVWLETGEEEVGRAVLKVLSMPEQVMHAIQDYWDGYLALPPVTLGDTLLLAEALSPMASPLHDPGRHGQGEGIMASIELSIGNDTLTSILSESAEEVESLTEALKF